MLIGLFDLEGPLSPNDHAAEAMAYLGQKLGKEESFYEFFNMISQYDDELFLVDKRINYWPGDTLKLIAPIIATYLTDKELLDISQQASLTPGAKELFDFFHQEGLPIYIISTSYSQHAHSIAKRLDHPINNVRCTLLPKDFEPSINTEKTFKKLFDDIFQTYQKRGIKAVKEQLDWFF
jgi:predicted HAD superfamily phosphohydrolase